MTTTRKFLFEEYKKAVRKGYYHYAWVILQNLHLKARLRKNLENFSSFYVNENGLLRRISQ